nr:MAG TPA: hypothetical protein [Caudoviricetes sp.]
MTKLSLPHSNQAASGLLTVIIRYRLSATNVFRLPQSSEVA